MLFDFIQLMLNGCCRLEENPTFALSVNLGLYVLRRKSKFFIGIGGNAGERALLDTLHLLSIPLFESNIVMTWNPDEYNFFSRYSDARLLR